MLRIGVEDTGGDGLEGCELRGAQIARDVECASIDKLLKAQIGWGFGGRPGGDEMLILGADGHDTTLLMLDGLRSCVYLTPEMGGKVSFGNA